MKNALLLATAYPYVAGILATVWLGSALLLQINPDLSFNLVLISNLFVSILIAAVGFRK